MPTKVIKLVVLGLGHMGVKSLFVIHLIKEQLRRQGIEVELAAVVDTDQRLKDALEFISSGLEPRARVILMNPEAPKPLRRILTTELGLNPRKSPVVIYDATPSHRHFINLNSIADISGVTYLGEKPLFTDTPQMSAKLRYAARYCCNFVETESLVSNAIRREIRSGFIPRSIVFWRFNSTGLAKILNPGARRGVTGGALMDKCIHDLSIAASWLWEDGLPEPVIEDAKTLCFVPGGMIGLMQAEPLFLSGKDLPISQIVSGFIPETGEDWTADAAGWAKVRWKTKPQVHTEFFYSWVGVRAASDLHRRSHVQSLREVLRDLKISEKRVITTAWQTNKTHWIKYPAEEARAAWIEGEKAGKKQSYFASFLSRSQDGVEPFLFDLERRRNLDIKDGDDSIAFGANSLARLLDKVIHVAAGEKVESYVTEPYVQLVHKLVVRIREKTFKRRGKRYDEQELAREVFSSCLKFAGKTEIRGLVRKKMPQQKRRH